MVELMVRYKWTYISILFSEGTYGENGGKQVERAAKKHGICVAYSAMVDSDVDDNGLSYIIRRMRQAKARVVVIFMEKYHHSLLFGHEDLLAGPEGEFIYISSDSIAGRDYGRLFDGGIAVFFPFRQKADFTDHVHRMTPNNSMHNRWYMDVWQKRYGCSYFNSSREACDGFEDQPLPAEPVDQWVMTTFDGFYAAAYALHNLIANKCPEMFTDPANVEDCVDGHDLLEYIKNNTFQVQMWIIHDGYKLQNYK